MAGPDEIDRYVAALDRDRIGSREFAAEIETHLRASYAELVESGAAPAVAAAAAVRRFGPLDANWQREVRQPWRPIWCEIAFAVVAASCAFGLAGALAALTRAAAGGTTFIGAVTDEASRRNLQRVIVGLCGAGLAVWMWARRAGPPVRPNRLPAVGQWSFAAAGAVCMALAMIDGVAGQEERLGVRWASLGVAWSALAVTYRRLRLAVWPDVLAR